MDVSIIQKNAIGKASRQTSLFAKVLFFPQSYQYVYWTFIIINQFGL